MSHYIARGILLAIPTLAMISLVAFVAIQLPPGDYLSTLVAQYAAQGETIDEEEVEALRRQYGLDKPIYAQYFKWVRNSSR